MPRSTWSAKDERQYKHIKKSCAKKCRSKKCMTKCTRIAAATVNKTRAKQGRTKKTRKLAGCGCSFSSAIRSL